MYSIAFPNIFSNGVKTNLSKDHDATYTNLKLLLKSNILSLFGDPYFGTALKRMLYENGTTMVKELIVDEIYTKIIAFMPQLVLKRNDVKVSTDGVDVFVKINCMNLIDGTSDLYTINMTNSEE